jgi:uncharacterized protein (TIGR01319 family)
LEKEEIISRTQSPSTVADDITIGLKKALKIVEKEIGNIEEKEAIACSSAAGGLQVVSIGLVPELSCEAAKRAALGAGAKIIGHYSYELTNAQVEEIEDIFPDLILLAGGTDGGNKSTIVHNARMLSHSKITAPIVIAGNRSVQDEIKEIFKTSNKILKFVGNVLPEIGKLEVQPCREAIRELFMQNIIKAKGLDKAKQIVKDIIMPTPVAVLNAAVLLSSGINEERGLGEIVVVDVGGATTDVYSIARGNPTKGGVFVKGLPEPFAKRTVEGDLGVRHNIDILSQIAKQKGTLLDKELISYFQYEPSRIPMNDKEMEFDAELARIATETALERHAGRIEIAYGPLGEMLVQIGKDLSEITKVIGTGGPIVFSSSPAKILSGAIANLENPYILKPKRAEFYLDEKYIMYAAGLLAQSDPKKAIRIMKKYLGLISMLHV